MKTKEEVGMNYGLFLVGIIVILDFYLTSIGW